MTLTGDFLAKIGAAAFLGKGLTTVSIVNKLPAVSTLCAIDVQSTGAQDETVSRGELLTSSFFLLIDAASVAITENNLQSDPRNHTHSSNIVCVILLASLHGDVVHF